MKTRGVLEAPALYDAWYRAMQSGDTATLKVMYPEHRLNANFTGGAHHKNPLAILAQADADPARHSGQTEIAAQLVKFGCEITVPDRFSMLPADHAMLSANKELARLLVIATMGKTERGQRPYVPYIGGYFATQNYRSARAIRFANFIHNKNEIAGSILPLTDEDNSFSLSNAQNEFWQSAQGFLPKGYNPERDIPHPSTALKKLETLLIDIHSGKEHDFAPKGLPVDHSRVMTVRELRVFQGEIDHHQQAVTDCRQHRRGWIFTPK